MHISKAIDGLSRYIDKYIYPEMNGLQQVGYLTLVETLKTSPEMLTGYLQNNFLLRMLLSMENNGEINIDRLKSALTKAVNNKGKIEIEVPMYGKFTFKSEDINEIIKHITEAV